MCYQRKFKEVDVVAVFYDGDCPGICGDGFPCRCFQRAGLVGWVAISVTGRSNMVFGFPIIPSSGKLLPGFGSGF